MIAENVKGGGFDYTAAPDGALIDLTLDGDHGAFECLVHRHRNRLFASMMRIARSAEIAEELVQEAFVQSYIKLRSFKREAAFSSWLFRIAFNKYLGTHRSRPVPSSLDSLSRDSHFEPIDERDSPEQACSRQELRQQINKALNRLEPNVRHILMLREMKGLSYAEIGEELEIKPGTVRSRLSRARYKLLCELSESSFNN